MTLYGNSYSTVTFLLKQLVKEPQVMKLRNTAFPKSFKIVPDKAMKEFADFVAVRGDQLFRESIYMVPAFKLTEMHISMLETIADPQLQKFYRDLDLEWQHFKDDCLPDMADGGKFLAGTAARRWKGMLEAWHQNSDVLKQDWIP